MTRQNFIKRKEELQRKLDVVTNKLSSIQQKHLDLLNLESNYKEQIVLIEMKLDKDVYIPMEL